MFEQSARFVDTQNNSVSQFVTNDNYYKFGLLLAPNATFNMIYSLTCAPTNCFEKRYMYARASPCPRTAFVIGANSPAAPIVDIVNYQLAIGEWKTSNNQILLQITFP